MPASTRSSRQSTDEDDEDKPGTVAEDDTKDEACSEASGSSKLSEQNDDTRSESTRTSELLLRESITASPSLVDVIEHGNPGLNIARQFRWSNYHDYDLITVHGIRDEPRTAWKTPDGNRWILDQLFAGLSVRQIDFRYEIDGEADVFASDGIAKQAQILLDEYTSNRAHLPSTEVDRPVIWICHDIGGTIAKQALIHAALEPLKYARIAHLTTAIIFLGSPHRANSIGELEDQLHHLLILPGPDIKSGIVQKIKDLSAQITTVNTQFPETKLTSRAIIMNIFSEAGRNSPEERKGHVEPLKANDTGADGVKAGSGSMESENEKSEETEELQKLENLETQNSNRGKLKPARKESTLATLQWKLEPSPEENPSTVTPFHRYTVLMGHPFETFCRSRVDASHLDLVKGGNSWMFFANFLNKIAYPIEVNYRILQNQVNLLSLVPPRRTTDLHFDAQDARDPVIAWIYECYAFQEFNVPVETKMLHLHVNKSETPSIGQLSQKLYIDYDLEYGNRDNLPEQSVLFFQFDKRDSRYNNIRAMLVTFLNDIIWHFWKDRAHQVTHVLNFFSSYRCFSLEDLYYAFNYLRDFAGVEQLTFFISCFDQCNDEERKWFLRRVLKKQGFTCMISKMIISTSGPDDFIMDEFPSIPTVDISACHSYQEAQTEASEAEIHKLRMVLVKLIKGRPIFQNYKSELTKLLIEFKTIPYLGRIIFTWLNSYKRGGPKAEIERVLERLSSATPQNVAKLFVDTLEESRRRAWAKEVYHWVKFAVQPLTPEILAQAVALSAFPDETWIVDIDSKEFCREIERVFGGMIIMDGRDIKFSHDTFYELPSFGMEGGDPNNDDILDIHRRIAEVCLRYLKSSEASETLSALSVEHYTGGVEATPLMLPRSNFAEYAVRFWPMHYGLSKSKAPAGLAMGLFQDRDTRNAWAEAFYILSNPFTRVHRSYFTPLPYMAMLGLEDLVRRQVESEKGTSSFNQSCWLAITEASRYGHRNIVLFLLDHAHEDQTCLRDAISWAASYGKDGALDILVDKARTVESFQWPEHILTRAASVGLVSLISALHASGYNMNEKDSSDDMTAVILAARCGQKEALDLLIKNEADLSILDKAGDPPLFQAVKRGDPDIVKSLITAGADVNQKDGRGGTAVNSAVDFGRFKALEILIEAGADFNTGEETNKDKDLDLRIPIVHAAEFGYKECVRILLEHNADARAESPTGSALYLASRNYMEICRILLEKGAEPNQCYEEADMLLLRAIASKNIEIVRLLLDKGAIVDSVDTSGPYCNTPLARAVEERSKDIFDLLLERGADVNFVGDRSWSPLFTAAYQGEFEMTKILVEKGANVHWKRSDGWTPLHGAYDTPNILELLLKHGANINTLSEDGTVVMLASKWNHTKSLERLLAQRPKPDLEIELAGSSDHDDFNCTALLIACKYGNSRCVKLLLDAGADMNYKMKDGSYALELCLNKGGTASEETLKVILEYKPDFGQSDDNGDTVLHSIRADTPLSVVKLLVESGAPADAANKDGYTPLAVAIDKENVEIARYLVSRGVNVNVFNRKFGSLLHLACMRNSVELFKVLIEGNADRSAVDLDFGEPLLYTAIEDRGAVRSRNKLVRYLVEEARVDVNAQGGKLGYPIILAAQKGQLQMVKYLIRRGADVNVADDLGRRAIHIAAAESREPIISVLIKAGSELSPKDKYGRTPLHFAALGLNTGLLIDSLPKGFDIDQPDHDGWTPLMWACRSEHSPSNLDKLIEQHGANIWARSRDNDWSPLKIANFHGWKHDETDQLRPPESRRTRVNEDGKQENWDDTVHESRPGDKRDSQCSSCFAVIYGIERKCSDCENMSFCFKCFGDQFTTHNKAHHFEEIGPLYKPKDTDKSQTNPVASSGGREETPESEEDEDDDGDGGEDKQEKDEDEEEGEEEEEEYNSDG